jgi:hypothetical protein
VLDSTSSSSRVHSNRSWSDFTFKPTLGGVVPRWLVPLGGWRGNFSRRPHYCPLPEFRIYWIGWFRLTRLQPKRSTSLSRRTTNNPRTKPEAIDSNGKPGITTVAVWVIVNVVWNGDTVAATGPIRRRFVPDRFIFLRQATVVSTAAETPTRTSLILTLMGKKSIETQKNTWRNDPCRLV